MFVACSNVDICMLGIQQFCIFSLTKWLFIEILELVRVADDYFANASLHVNYE